VTLDDDVSNLLQGEIRRSGVSFKEAINRYLRLGLMAAQNPQPKEFVVHPRPLGLPAGLSYDNVEELVTTLEGSSHK
jgi:hypothetical protein